MLKLLTLGVAAVNAEVYFSETFSDSTWEDRWVNAGDGKFAISAGKVFGDAEDDKGLQTSEDAKFYQISSAFPTFSNKGKDLVISFDVKHDQKIDCGGGYLKFTPAGLDQASFNGDSEYNIMFGPDICGSTKKVHFIVNYKGKNVLINKNVQTPTDEKTHTFTLILKPDQSYDIQVDGESKESGSIVDDFDFLQPKMIKDPEISKPADWVDDAMIDDPEDVKPDDWEQPKMIVDPEAERPEDWDEEDDGEWEAPTVDNPEYKGEWSAKRIENPEYKGVWVHPEIANPEYEEDEEIYAFDSFGAVGIDIWQVKSGSIFDNVIIADSIDEVTAFIKEHDHKEAETEAFNVLEEEKKAAAAEEMKAAEAARAAEDDEEDDEDDEDLDDLIKLAKEEL